MSTLIIAEQYTVGEIPAPITYTFQNSSGQVLDNLTDFTVVFQYILIEEDATAVERDATKSNPILAEVEYVWVEEDMETPGSYLGQFIAGNGTNRYYSPKIFYTVEAGIGEVPNI